LRQEQQLQSEVEFEWIRQFYIQGENHYALHTWWHEPMQELLELWQKLESKTLVAVQAAKDRVLGILDEGNGQTSKKSMKKRKQRAEMVSRETVDILVQSLADRLQKREGWLARERDPLYRSLAPSVRPMEVPCALAATSASELKDTIAMLQDLLKRFAA
jgi:FTO C-terminal domain